MPKHLFFLASLFTIATFLACSSTSKTGQSARRAALPEVEVRSFKSQETYPGVESNFRMAKTFIIELKGRFPDSTSVGGLFYEEVVLDPSFRRVNGTVERKPFLPLKSDDLLLELTFSRSYFFRPEEEEFPLGGARPSGKNLGESTYQLALVAGEDTLWVDLGEPVPMKAIYAP